MRKTTKTGRYAKIAASAVVVLLFGLVTSTALADDSPFSAPADDSPFSVLAGDNGFSALDALMGSTSTSTTSAPTVSTDKGDYAPGELVTLRGTNWHPAEAVHIYVNDDQGRTWERDSDVVADEDGVIVDSFNLPNWFVATYSVVATGATSGTATAAFTDANPQSVQIAPGSRTVAPGASAEYTVTVPIAGNDGLCTLDLSASGLPAGATATFGNTSLTGTKGESPSTSLTVDTTGVTPPGTTTFTVTAARQSNCQGNGNLTGTANLVVAKSVGAVAVGPQTGTLTAGTAGSATYSVTVNRNGATGAAFTANLSATGLPAGATASFNPNTVSFASGETSKTSAMTVVTTSAASAASTPFTVRATNPNATGDFSDGNGNLVVDPACTAASATTQPSNQSITYGANATVTAAGAGNPAPSVQWQASTNGGSNWTNLSGETGTTLTITKPGVSQSGNQYRAVFTNTCGGTQTVASNAATLSVAAKAITVTPDSGQSKVYGASDPTLTYTANAALESGDGFTGALSRGAGEHAGNYAITLGNLSAGANYAISLSTPPVTFAITTKAITVTADDKTKVYGSDDPALTVTVPNGALETGDTITGNLVRASGNNVGSYAITQGTLTAGSNYDLTVTPGTLTITKKTASVTAVDKSKVYGSADPALTTTDSGFLADDLGADKISLSATRAAGESVGTYTIAPAAADAATSLLGNYQVTYNTGQLTITKKAASVSAVADTKVYGSDDPVLGTTHDGFLAADLGAAKISFSATRAAGQSVGTYTITPAAADGQSSLLSNYDVALNPADLTITKKPITVKADDKTKVYGSDDPALTVTVPAGALETGDSLSGNPERANGKDVGSYAITKGTLTAGGNYELTVTPGTLTITEKAITVAADDKTKVYGSADPALTVTVPNGALESGDSLSGELERAAGNNVGDYAITKGSLTAGVNYDLTVTPGVFKITAKAITVGADDKSKVYGSADPALTVTVPNGALETGDSLSGELERAAGKDVGSYQITKGSLTAGGNYDLTVTLGVFKITKKPITVEADDKSKVYGSADPALTVTVPNGALESGDSLSGSLVRASGNNVGGYAITEGTLTAGSNYDLTVTPGTLTITKKAASVTAADKSKVYGSDDPELTTTDSGFLAADLGAGKITFSATRAAGESVVGAPYTITPSASDAATRLLGNYDVTYNNGQLTITRKAITGSFVAADKVYDGNTDAADNSRDLTGLVGDDAVSLVGGSAAFDTKNTGNDKTVTLTGATLSGADAGNYSLESVATAKANITPKPITVKADDKTKVYGSADPALTVTVPAGALETGDSLSGELERAAGNNVGDYAITKGSLTAGGNYDLTVTPGAFTITKKPITVAAVDKTKVYGSADPALTVTVPNGALETGDSLSGYLERAAGQDVGSYAITKGSLTAGGNYELTVTPGTLTITKKAITVTADDKAKVIGAADPTLIYKVTSGSLESGDSLSGALTRAPGETVGTYTITQGTLTAGGNYALTFVGSTLKIVYGWDGFLQPINDTAHQTGVQQSKFKLGQTIPAKFLLKNAAGAVVRQETDPTFTRSGNLGACDSTAATDTTEAVTPDAGSAFKWDGSQYHYNWSTKNLTTGEYRIYANLADGTKQYVDICLAK